MPAENNTEHLSMEMACKIADRFNERGLRQNKRTLALAATMLGYAIKSGGILSVTRRGRYFSLVVIPSKPK